MESKFTPGPWKVKSEDGAYVDVHGDQLIDGKSGVLARVLLTGDDFSNANGHLIAAAPDLYAALNKAYLDILNIINEGEFKEGIEWNSGYIEDALKKARGE